MAFPERGSRREVLQEVLQQNPPKELQQFDERAQAFYAALNALAQRSERQDPRGETNNSKNFPPLNLWRSAEVLPENLRNLVDIAANDTDDFREIKLTYYHSKGTTREHDFHAFEVAWRTNNPTDISLIRIEPGLDIFDEKPQVLYRTDEGDPIHSPQRLIKEFILENTLFENSRVLPYFRSDNPAENAEMQRAGEITSTVFRKSPQDQLAILEEFIGMFSGNTEQ